MSSLTTMTPAQRDQWERLLAGLMLASKTGDSESAEVLYKALGRTFGIEIALCSLLYLADRAAAPWVAGGSASVNEAIVGSPDHQGDVESLPYPSRWAARMVAAAADRDLEAQCALVDGALRDGQLGACVPVLALLAASVPVVMLP
jgi:hypothetical protein